MVSHKTLFLTSLYQLATTVVFVALSLWLWPSRALAVLAGGALLGVNFWALRYFAVKAFAGSKPKVAYALALAVKLVAMMGLMALCLSVLRLDGLGFGLGLSSLFVAIGLATAHQAFAAADKTGPSPTQVV
ncbi:MAG: hypothetical protein HY903_07225 [Deltaproteobacteria bacterium]|nr:hypothetical protein [Deltaproteobacteria bacterium]